MQIKTTMNAYIQLTECLKAKNKNNYKWLQKYRATGILKPWYKNASV